MHRREHACHTDGGPALPPSALGENAADLTGVVTADGRLNLSGTWNLLDFEGEIVLATSHVGAWDTTLSAPGVMTGRWSQDLVSVGPAGNVYMENELVTMARTSTSVTPSSSTTTLPAES